jgi:Outer membrane cobalamin receptor protein
MTSVPRWTPRTALVGAAMLLLPTTRAAAQTVQTYRSNAASSATSLTGVVRDSTGAPLGGVELRLVGATSTLARTDERGGFRLPPMDVGLHSIALRRLGFEPAVVDVRIRPGHSDSLVITMAQLVAVLDEVAVIAERDARSKKLLPEFWRRRKNGFGFFMTRDEIEDRHAENLIELIRRVPGVRTMQQSGRQTVRFARSLGARDCPPQYIVDGIRITNGSPDEFAPTDVEALEIYTGLANLPVEYQPHFDTYTCGAIVIWTRLPG